METGKSVDGNPVRLEGRLYNDPGIWYIFRHFIRCWLNDPGEVKKVPGLQDMGVKISHRVPEMRFTVKQKIDLSRKGSLHLHLLPVLFFSDQFK